ncbi:MAG: pseudouridine synthase [Meiothermus sp.]|nr:pseudouridine synthase [Meiothermus sp.]
MRLQQYLARSGVTSRRKAEELIRAGRVTINNQVAELGAVVGERDVVRLDGERVRMPTRSVVIALNKPKGYTTTHEDEHAEKLVYQLVPEHPGLHSVGRLDKDTEGLLLLTNDGNLTQKLTHPSNEVPKLYRVWSKKGRLSVLECQRLIEGLMLGDGFAKAVEAVPTKEGAKLVLTEGRKREVRRMLGKLGHPVERLVRLAVGVIELGELKPGEYRYLEPPEVQLLMEGAAPPKLRKPTPAAKQRRAPKPQDAGQKPPRPAGKAGSASGGKPSGKPRASGASALGEANQARIARVMQRLGAEDAAEIPASASQRPGRANKAPAQAPRAQGFDPQSREARPPRKPKAELPQRSSTPEDRPRRSRRPEGEARAARPTAQDARTRPSGRSVEGAARGARPRPVEARTPAKSRRPEGEAAGPKTRFADAKPQRSREGSKPRAAQPPAQKSVKPISQKPKPTVKSGDERVRGGQGQGANQRGANKSADRRARAKNTK